MSYEFYILNDKNLNVKAENINSDAIRLCLIHELFSMETKDKEYLERKVFQSSTLEFVINDLFLKLKSARKPHSQDITFNKIDSFDNEYIYEDKDGNRVDISALKLMQVELAKKLKSCEETSEFAGVLKTEMMACLNDIHIPRYEIITNEDFLDNRNTTKTGTNIAVDVSFTLDGNEWVVQTWNGFVDDSCQTTIDDNYIELFNNPVSQRLLCAVYYACRLTADDAIKDRSDEHNPI